MKYRYLFGPVPSRRLGLSLGVDCVPFKICNLNCIYCECGPTPKTVDARREYVAAAAILGELSEYLQEAPALDVITLTGSGEPLLNRAIGDIVAAIKSTWPQYKIALLTNGTLLQYPEVRRAVSPVDYVLPSLDAITPSVFKKINQPHASLNNDTVIRGIIDFAHEYKGALWMELFIVPGINDSENELKGLKEALLKIAPARVQLNTLDRPAAFSGVSAASTAQLERIAAFLAPL
ncbi:MAG: radical SAM protein, partial [Chitinivibrionales bacterium]|nr:radical SAM protein [Chitinivibrionales bacterium]